ncbi:MAG: family 10 glycosylhydrolase [bacterium]|jgi:uncharacterized lipoprotein YddW (UPF0748 family)
MMRLFKDLIGCDTVRRFILTIVTLPFLSIGVFPTSSAALTGRAVWAHPWEAGKSTAEVLRFVKRLEDSQVNTLIMMFKGVDGRIYFPSERYADAVVSGYKTFDFPRALIEACHERGIEVHAWFCDFAEGATAPAVRTHPEWIMRNPERQGTNSEILRGKPYGITWMCPARRPGYTDQWLIPMIVEFARRYDVDAIHHDYVRFPGDVAPDRYCFCDHCLEEIPRYAGYYWRSYPEREFEIPRDRPHLEAHWEKSPRVLPGNWQEMTREEKSHFLLGGSFFSGGREDLDYYFYQYRRHWINRFVEEVFQEVRKVKPEMRFSAAVFRNPIQAGRFLGQDWRDFAPWVQTLIPMDYRSHFPGTVQEHRVMLQESIEQQKQWARDFEQFWVGLSCGQLSEKEFIPTLETVKKTGVEGISIFSAGSLSRTKQWNVLGKFFSDH